LGLAKNLAKTLTLKPDCTPATAGVITSTENQWLLQHLPRNLKKTTTCVVAPPPSYQLLVDQRLKAS
jgi:hypothetical protein